MENELKRIEADFKEDVARICVEACVAVTAICVAGMSFVVWAVTKWSF
jgi:hypothetical protein